MVPHDYIVALDLELNKVNPNGPSLKLSVGSSVSEVLHQEIPGLNLIDIPEKTSEIPYILLDHHLSHLQ
jgi:hypothetical protein